MLLIKYSEIALKKNNRYFFENKLVENIKKSLSDYDVSVIKEYGRIYVINNQENEKEAIILKLQKVSGIVEICECKTVELDIDNIANICVSETKDYKNMSFKVESRRTNKGFKLKSPELSSYIGHVILENNPYLTVDVKNPDFIVYLEIRDKAYIYIKTHKGLGGLPMGSVGKSLLLMSGGIDSVVAGYMMARRGVKISAVHFHSFPFTSEESVDKVRKLLESISDYTGEVELFLVNILPIQNELRKKTSAEYFTILQRRSMTRIANKIAKRIHAKSLITGENIAQVASQTMEGINCTNDASIYPIFRPLISMDKQDIITISKRLNTYEISILPFDDCCTVFLPPKVNTKPKLKNILIEERKYDYRQIEWQILDDIKRESIKK